jgi:hypothetical protein
MRSAANVPSLFYYLRCSLAGSETFRSEVREVSPGGRSVIAIHQSTGRQTAAAGSDLYNKISGEIARIRSKKCYDGVGRQARRHSGTAALAYPTPVDQSNPSR